MTVPGAHTLQSLAAALPADAGARIVGDPATVIHGLGALADAEPGTISHLSSPAYRDLLPATRASAVILAERDLAQCPCAALVVANPYLTFARISQMFVRADALPNGVHRSAVIGEGVQIDPAAAIGANVVIGRDTVVGAHVRIHANAVIGERCVLEEAVEIRSNATLYSDVKLGARTIIHSAAVIGGDGFGFTPDRSGQLVTIAQLGGVRIGADVSVGSCSSIDRGAIGDTVIEDGVKIDNQVQIGHNCHIGAHTIICGCVGIVGSTRIGRHCIFAGGSGVGGERPIEICDRVVVSAVTTITSSIDKPGVYSGSVLHNSHAQWKRNALSFNMLDRLVKRVRRLERKFDDGA